MTEPAWLARNFTPTSMPPVSGSALTAGVAVDAQMLQGQPGLLAAAVVNVQVTACMVLPAVSFAPETVAVYVVDPARPAPGVNVALLDAAS